ncbi:MAG: glycoside hydrolase family 9 protein, partial [SAR324 cluster bacterium]|nr:glycoside hydrolase family 9 protein [SAR324 cluster bacterium]
MKNSYRNLFIISSLILVLMAVYLLVQHFSGLKKPSAYKTDMIMVNHVGFLPGSPKYCVIPGKSEKEFSIHRLQHTVWTEVLREKLTKGGAELGEAAIGRFNDLQVEGIYQVRCGKLRSRCFVVSKSVYNVPMRVLFNYFPWQRCGDSKTGWNAPCHLEDGIIEETAEHIDLVGGYHQSGDLRKWAEIQPIGLMGLVAFGITQAPEWGDRTIEEEIKWGCDYFHKLVREDGGIPHSVFVPIGWGPREWYQIDAPVSAHWMIIRYQAMAAAYFKQRDPSYSATCLQVAKKIWLYMNSDKRPKGQFKAYKIPPLGHDGLNSWYAGFYEGSALDHAHRLCAAIELFKVTGDSFFLDSAASSATALTSLQVADTIVNNEQSAACFREGPDSENLAESFFQFWHMSGPIGLCKILELAPDHNDAAKWKRAVERIAEQNLKTSRQNPWGLIAVRWYTNGVEPPVKSFFTIESTKSRFGGGYLGAMKPGGVERYSDYEYFPSLYNLDIMAAGLFMRKASDVTGNHQYAELAQRQLDWIMGCNPFDCSTIEGVGYNQPHRGIFGEFFPPIPQIPGAVSIGVNEGSF